MKLTPDACPTARKILPLPPFGELEIRLVRFRHRLEAVVEVIVVVLRADHLAERTAVDAPIALDRVPRRREGAGILDMDIDLERLALVDHVETLDDVQLFGM